MQQRFFQSSKFADFQSRLAKAKQTHDERQAILLTTPTTNEVTSHTIFNEDHYDHGDHTNTMDIMDVNPPDQLKVPTPDPLHTVVEPLVTSACANQEQIIQTYLVENNDYKSFDFQARLLERLQRLSAAEFDLAVHAEPLFANSKISVGEFGRRCNTLFVKNDLSFQGRKEIMDMLNDVFTDANIPTYSRRKGKYSMQEIVEPIEPFMEFHACPTGDFIYVGENSGATVCAKCGKARTNRCPVSFCEESDEKTRCVHYQTRTPQKVVIYKPITEIIQNLLRFETFHDLLGYESTSTTLGDLKQCGVPNQHSEQMYEKWEEYLESSKGNISHVVKNPKTGKIDKAYLLDEEVELVPINILLGVNYDGIQPFKRRSVAFNPLIATILNLPPFLRSIVGVGMFTLSIVTGGDSGKVEGKVLQDFIIHNCFVKELMMLEKGIILENISAYGRKQYFVQVRLILHMYDTRALEDIMLVQAAGAYAACPLCGIVHGGLRSELGKVVYLGHRRLLPIAHYLRRIGQGNRCCPLWFHRDYFRKSDEHRPILLDDAGKVINEAPMLKEAGLPQDKPYIIENWEQNKSSLVLTNRELGQLNPCEGNADNRLHINQLKYLKLDDFLWFHTDIVSKANFVKFMQPNLYYHYADYRPTPDSLRVTTEMHIKHANLAMINKHPVRGVKGLCAFLLLSYFDKETQVNWDPFHVLMNIAKALLLLLKGDRVITPTVSRYCDFFYFHPYLDSSPIKTSKSAAANKKQKRDNTSSTEIPTCVECNAAESTSGVDGELKRKERKDDSKLDSSTSQIKKAVAAIKRPWELSKSIQYLFDACLQGLYIPACNKHRFEVKKPFLHTGLLGGVAKIQVFTILAKLLCSVIWQCDDTYPKRYLYFYLMFATDARKLLQDSFDQSEIDELYNFTAETVATAEGLWPHSELLYPFHQLTDLPQFIKHFGALKNWWTLPGERAASQVKNKVPAQGGSKYEKVAFTKQVEDEKTIFEAFYSIDIVSLVSGRKSSLDIKLEHNVAAGVVNKVIKSCKNWLNVSPATPTTLQYHDKQIVFVDNPQTDRIALTDYEKDKFHEMMHMYIEEVVLNKDAHSFKTFAGLYRGSAYLRLYFMFQRYKGMKKGYTFAKWLIDVTNNVFAPSPTRIIDIKTLSDEEIVSRRYEVWCPLACVEVSSFIQLEVEFTKDAQIGSVQFTGRGHRYREDENSTYQYYGYTPNKECNALELHWQEDLQRDSWCKYESNHRECKSAYGQLNGFFKMYSCDDTLLGHFASVTTRKTVKFGFEYQLDCVSLQSLENYWQSPQPFIILDAVKLHVVTHFPITAEIPKNNPTLKPFLEATSDYKEKLSEEYFCQDAALVKFLCLIPLDA